VGVPRECGWMPPATAMRWLLHRQCWPLGTSAWSVARLTALLLCLPFQCSEPEPMLPCLPTPPCRPSPLLPAPTPAPSVAATSGRAAWWARSSAGPPASACPRGGAASQHHQTMAAPGAASYHLCILDKRILPDPPLPFAWTPQPYPVLLHCFSRPVSLENPLNSN